MSRQNNKELLLTIDRQGEQLRRYEARLRDVVLAYKGLQKEKSALEKSLRVLSGTDSKPTQESPLNHDGNTNEELGVESKVINDHKQKSDDVVTVQAVHDANDKGLETQVKTLREALDTIMEQKTKMEGSFQADRKKYLLELEKKDELLEQVKNEFQRHKEKMQKEISELRARTCGEQKARETEHNDHVMMLKEMQQLVSKERSAREELQRKIESLEKTIMEKEVPDSTCTFQGRDSTKGLDKSIQVSNTSSTLTKLEEDMQKIKAQLEKDIMREQQRANEAELKASLLSKAEENRVADLEAKLSELSNVVGKYERLRAHDQVEIKKLKDRLHTMAITPSNDVSIKQTTDMNVNNDKILVMKFKELLQSCIKDEEISEENDLGLSRADLECILQTDPAHRACREELRQLKDEFECYKAKIRSSKNSPLEKLPNNDTESEKKVLDDLKTTLQSMQIQLDNKDDELETCRESFDKEKANLRKLHISEIESERTIYMAKMQELEREMQSQRSRTMALISEKDVEIERLQKKMAKNNSESPAILRRNQSFTLTRKSSSDDTIDELLLQSYPSSLLHFAQEQAHCDAEFVLLKKQHRELEESVQEFERREEQTYEQVKLLKEEIRKLERNCSRENANMEYVKNVVLRYLLTDSESVRQQMIAAISTILQFSPEEVFKVKQGMKRWWGRA